MTNVTFRINGLSELTDRLAGVPEEVHKAIIQKLQAAASHVSKYIKDEKLSGQVLKARSGRLRASIYGRVYDSRSQVTMQIGSRGDVPYAAIQEYGGETSAHIIAARRTRMLSFIWGGRRVYFRQVSHPGSVIKEASYLRSGLDDQEATVRAEVAAAVWEACHGGIVT